MSFNVYSEYTTLTEVLNQYLTSGGTPPTTDNVLLLDMIREASRMIDESAEVAFYPVIETRNFDLPLYGVDLFPSVPKLQPSDEMKLGGLFGAELRFDTSNPLLEVVSLLNGDGSSIAASNYWLYPPNDYPKRSLKLKPTSGITWLLDPSGNWEQVLALTAVWGFHEDYARYAWFNTGNTLNGNLDNVSTSLAYLGAVNTMYPGVTLKIDSEFMYVSSGIATPLTVIRKINGSTPASHTSGATIFQWQPNKSITGICRRAAAALYDLRATKNPIGGRISIDGAIVQVPADVQDWIEKQLGLIGNQRVVFA